MNWFMGITLFVMNVIAIGVFTGHTERYLGWASSWHRRSLNSNGDEGCYTLIQKVNAISIFVFTALFLFLVLIGWIQI